MLKTTTCVPVATAISEGVLPTYFPSIVMSAPDGVELKSHLMVACSAVAEVEAEAGEAEVAGTAVAGAGCELEGRAVDAGCGVAVVATDGIAPATRVYS